MPAHRRLTFLALALLAGSAANALAAPALDPMFGDGAVIQRDRPIHVRGSASPGETVRVTLGGATRSAVAGTSGEWRASFPAMRAGGPHELTVAGAGGSVRATGILIGDVWLCSGQSNMEWPLRRSAGAEEIAASANDPELRMLTVPQRSLLAPERLLASNVRWQALTPDAAPHMSAVCLVMARELRRHAKVPIGAINASWGGTRIRPWMDEAAARSVGYSEDADLLALYRTDPAAAARGFTSQWQEWWRGVGGTEPWRDSNALTWRTVPAMTYWNDWPDADLGSFDGLVWARRKFTLTAAEAAKKATLSLGVIDDFDQTWVNGVGVGNSFGWSFERDYQLPAGVLKAGDNEILVNVGDEYGPGGFQGPAEKIALRFADGSTKPLGAGWQYSVVRQDVGRPPRGPWQSHIGLSTLYNGMIAPLGPLGLKGVAWYQGESDVGIAGYDQRLAAMMRSWRTQFQNRELPFLIVGLAGYGKIATAPAESGWAKLQDEQRRAADRDRRADLVPALDLGLADDIHPTNKRPLGERLALAARSLAYGEEGLAHPPLPLGVRREGGNVVVMFSRALQARSNARPIGFELCGAAGGSCRYVDATISGNSVILADPQAGATRVRYAWSDYAVVNLYSGELPAPTFELSID